ncbi:methyltransferase [Shewanella youngdeokensis]|uniref:Methyltransferase n=1 Tax=Shewanella youngdeokensis TaxID=2999068 RepID=A0ABZ0JV04_9GAMM|nr:methyltransferase [Shewanella sp. DAU334]
MPQNNSQASLFTIEFKQLDTLLNASRQLWQNRSFECKQLPWADSFPALAHYVWSIPDADIDAIDACQVRLNQSLLPFLQQDLSTQGLTWNMELFIANLSPVTSSVQAKAIMPAPLIDSDDMAHFSAHIKGRKWQQITAFVAQLPDSTLPVLEWCAGKGHLGRLIAKAKQRSVVSLEWQQSLCDAGQRFADQWQLPQRFVCADAFAGQNGQLQAKQLAVALHACGDLHVTLLRHASDKGTKQVVISPCCYHLIQAKHYQPLSAEAQMSPLMLSRADLQLPLQQSTIASTKHNQYRLQEMAWRLGFDSLQRDMRGEDQYLPIPSIKQSQLNGAFDSFCLWAAGTKNVPLASDVDWAHYENLGYERQRLTRRIDLVAHLFRAILERWLLLDRVCFMQEAGYQVELSEFCANSVTPRNALIRAFK